MGIALALVGVELSLPGRLAAQSAGDGRIPVGQRFDPVVGSYRPAVVEPLSLAAVRAIQQALTAAGSSPGPVTGVLETRTRAALRDFQAANGLRISGRPDYDTVLALRVPARPATPAEVAQSQPSPRAYDIVIIGPGDSLGPRPPVVGGVGATPGGQNAPPPVPGSGTDTAPDPGVAPVPEPGVEPAPSPGLEVIPAPGAAPGPAPGVIVLPAPPPAPAKAAPGDPAKAPPPVPAAPPAMPDSQALGPESGSAR